MEHKCTSCKVDTLAGRVTDPKCYACTILRGMALQTIAYCTIGYNEGWVTHTQYEPMMN